MGRRSSKGLRNVLALGTVSFFTDVSSEMSFSILPLFYVKELGANKSLIGLLEGLAEMFSYTLRLPSGLISDRFGRPKKLVTIGYALSNVTKPFFALASVWTDALVVRLTDRVGKGIRIPPRDSLLGVAVPRRVGFVFGLHRMLDQAGAIVGPLIALALLSSLGLRGIFWISAIPGIVALVILGLYVVDSPARRRTNFSLKPLLQIDFVKIVAVNAVFALGAFNFSFVLLRAASFGIPDNLVPLVYAIINIAHTLVAIPAGLLADRVGKQRALLLVFGTFTLTCLIAIIGSSWVDAVILALLFGTYFGSLETVQKAVVPGYVHRNLLASAYGFFSVMIGVCSLAANLIVGVLWDLLGPGAAFLYSLLVSLLAIGSLLILVELRRPASGIYSVS